jgi:hypothetical protein
MKDKYIVELYDDEGKLQSSSIYKSYKQISKDLGEAYHDCRAIHLIGNGSMKKKFVHPTLKR